MPRKTSPQKSRLKDLTQMQEIGLMGPAAEKTATNILRGLKKLPRKDRLFIGQCITRMRQRFAETYPGQTRTRRVPNTAWEKAGFPKIAKANRLMGLKGM